MPEWKNSTFGKDVSYGKQTDKSIKEQREALPIFQQRENLLAAIKENQVLIVIGETGSGTSLFRYHKFLNIKRKDNTNNSVSC